jgi:3-dehydroquinate synthase
LPAWCVFFNINKKNETRYLCAMTEPHPIHYGPAGAQARRIFENGAYSRVFILCDTHTHRHCVPQFLSDAGWDTQPQVLAVPAGEQYKKLATCEQIWSAFLTAGLDRQALVINLGGGVIGDMGGFCAATYKRGVDFIQAPTTLLAMTDAAVGGKVGIDFQDIKNAIGVFRMPVAVLIDTRFLNTLPFRELRSGFAEVLKHARIGDPALWAQLQGISDLRQAPWDDLLPRSLAVKERVVAEDPLEKGLRAVLNYGHTVGHALESYFLHSPQPLTHGEAVYAGMLIEEMLAGRAPLVWPYWGPLPILPAGVEAELWALMQQDKKNTSGKVMYTVPDVAPFSMLKYTLELPALEQALERFRTYVSASQS